VKWHQDIQFRPHTNYSLLTVGTYLCDCGREQGPLGVIPGSHDGDLFDQYNEKRQWIGCISDADLPRLDLSIADYLTGPAGSLTIHNCRTVHGSRENESAEGRPLSLATITPRPTRCPTPITRCNRRIWVASCAAVRRVGHIMIRALAWRRTCFAANWPRLGYHQTAFYDLQENTYLAVFMPPSPTDSLMLPSAIKPCLPSRS
jgi:hypothetical protein